MNCIDNHAAVMIPGSDGVETDVDRVFGTYTTAIRALFNNLCQNPIRAAASSVHPVSFDALARHRVNLISSEWLLFLKEFKIMPQFIPRSEAMLLYHKFAKGKEKDLPNKRSEFTYGDFLSALHFIARLPALTPFLIARTNAVVAGNITFVRNGVGPLLSWQLFCEYLRALSISRLDLRWRVWSPHPRFVRYARTLPRCLKDATCGTSDASRYETLELCIGILEDVLISIFDVHLVLPVPAQDDLPEYKAKERKKTKSLSPVRGTHGSHNRKPGKRMMSKIKQSRSAFGGSIHRTALQKRGDLEISAALKMSPLRSLVEKDRAGGCCTQIKNSVIVVLEILDDVLKLAFQNRLLLSKDFYPKIGLSSRLRLSEQTDRYALRAKNSLRQTQQEKEVKMRKRSRMYAKFEAERLHRAHKAGIEKQERLDALQVRKDADHAKSEEKRRRQRDIAANETLRKKRALEEYKAEKEAALMRSAQLEMASEAKRRAELRMRLAAVKVRNANRFLRKESKREKILQARKRAQERIRQREARARAGAEVDRDALAERGRLRSKTWTEKLKLRQAEMRKQIEIRKLRANGESSLEKGMVFTEKATPQRDKIKMVRSTFVNTSVAQVASLLMENNQSESPEELKQHESEEIRHAMNDTTVEESSVSSSSSEESSTTSGSSTSSDADSDSDTSEHTAARNDEKCDEDLATPEEGCDADIALNPRMMAFKSLVEASFRRLDEARSGCIDKSGVESIENEFGITGLMDEIDGEIPIRFKPLFASIRRVISGKQNLQEEAAAEEISELNSVTEEPEGDVALDSPQIDARSIGWSMSGNEESLPVFSVENNEEFEGAKNDFRAVGITEEEDALESSIRTTAQDFISGVMPEQMDPRFGMQGINAAV